MGGVWCCGSDLAFFESAVLSLMVKILGEICQAVGAVTGLLSECPSGDPCVVVVVVVVGGVVVVR